MEMNQANAIASSQYFRCDKGGSVVFGVNTCLLRFCERFSKHKSRKALFKRFVAIVALAVVYTGMMSFYSQDNAMEFFHFFE